MMTNEGNEWITYKVVCVGDGGVGKTSLLSSYAKNSFPEDYVPTVFDNFRAVVSYRERIVDMNIWDTAGQEELGSMRKLSYVNTDLFLLCFSLVYPTSWKNVVTHWIQELEEEQWSSTRPIILLVGCKMDVREKYNTSRPVEKIEQPLQRVSGRRLAQRIGADGYCETSAKTLDGVKELFDHGIELLLRRDKKILVDDGIDELCDDEIGKMSQKKKKKKKKNWFLNISNCDCEGDLSKFLQ